MAEVSKGIIICNSCGRRFKWKPELAGKQAKCSCGQLITIPTEAPDDDLYDLTEPAPAVAAVPEAKPAIGSSAQGIRPLPYARPRGLEVEDKFSPEKFRNVQAPLILIGIGIIVQLTSAWLTGAHVHGDLSKAMISVGSDMVISTAIMLVAILIAARFRGIALGSIGTAILKLAAISVAPTAAVMLIYPLLMIIPFGWIVGLAIEFCLYFALLGFFFELDESDTWYCVAVMFIVTVVIALGKTWAWKWL